MRTRAHTQTHARTHTRSWLQVTRREPLQQRYPACPFSPTACSLRPVPDQQPEQFENTHAGQII